MMGLEVGEPTQIVWSLVGKTATYRPAQATAGGGGLPTGWTQDDEDPSNVFTNGAGAGGTGSLTLGTEDGPEGVAITSLGLGAVDEFGNQWLVMETALGILLTPKMDAGGPAITIDSSEGATVALVGAGLPIIQIADPTNPQDAATKAYVDQAIAAALGA